MRKWQMYIHLSRSIIKYMYGNKNHTMQYKNRVRSFDSVLVTVTPVNVARYYDTYTNTTRVQYT